MLPHTVSPAASRYGSACPAFSKGPTTTCRRPSPWQQTSTRTASEAAQREVSTGSAGIVPASTHQAEASMWRLVAPKQGSEVPLVEGAYSNPAVEDVGRLERLGWVQELLAQPGQHVVLQCAAMNPEPGVDPDHLFLGLLQQGIIRDVLFLFNPASSVFHSLVALGADVCGHPCTVHGGFTSAVIDETTGGLVFCLKKSGLLGSGPAFTVRLEVDYKKPIPADSNIVCIAKVHSMEGRKVWVEAEVLDRPDGAVYAAGRALYVTPREYA